MHPTGILSCLILNSVDASEVTSDVLIKFCIFPELIFKLEVLTMWRVVLLYILYLLPANEVCEGYVVYRCLSVHRGPYVCVCHAAPQACMPPRHACPQACTPPWAYAPPDTHIPLGSHAQWGASMSGRYASYWNAFLFLSDIKILVNLLIIWTKTARYL